MKISGAMFSRDAVCGGSAFAVRSDLWKTINNELYAVNFLGTDWIHNALEIGEI